MSVLKQKILDRTVTLGVVGRGYVGLPLAVEKAKAGFKVIGFDVQDQKVNMVNQGHNYIGDVVDSDLEKIVREGYLRATTDFASVASCDCVCIAVPTPLDAHQQPDISYVRSSAESIMPHMHKDMLIVLESTTYPGTTEELLKPILEKSGLKCGVDFYLAFSPERVDPGNLIYKTKNTPKVVGGCTPECTDIAATLYEAVLEAPVHRVSCPAVAEMEKILENTYRNVNIGLVNELAMLIGYEVTRELELKDMEVETPVAVAKTKVLAGKKLGIVPILRAGLGMVDGMLSLIPAAKVGHIGLYRDPETLQPVDYYCKLPQDVEERDMIIVDPMLATGGSAVEGINILKRAGCKSIRLVNLIAAPEGIKVVQDAHPDVNIYVAAVDSHLNDHGYIVPGLGDAGDRLFGTK